MKEANDIVKELKELNSTLAYMPRTMPYNVPSGYFETLHEYIQAGIWADTNDDPSLSFNSKDMPYKIPIQYFEELPDGILASLKKSEQTLNIRATTFDVPNSYFEKLPAQMLQAVKNADNKPATKTIPLGRKIWENVRWAAAAILIIGIGIGSYQFLQTKPKDINTEQQLAQLPDETIENYVHQNIDDFDTEMITGVLAMNDAPTAVSQLSDKEIIDYLNENGLETTVN